MNQRRAMSNGRGKSVSEMRGGWRIWVVVACCYAAVFCLSAYAAADDSPGCHMWLMTDCEQMLLSYAVRVVSVPSGVQVDVSPPDFYGRAGDVTPFYRSYCACSAESQTVTLSAPSFYTLEGVHYAFQRWSWATYKGPSQESANQTVSFTVNGFSDTGGAANCVAVYAESAGEPDIIQILPIAGHVPLSDVLGPVWVKGMGELGQAVCTPFTGLPLRLRVRVEAPPDYPADWLETKCDWTISSDWEAPTVSGSTEPFPGRLGTVEIPIPPSVGDRTLTLDFRVYGRPREGSESLLKERSIQLPLHVVYGPPLIPNVDSLLAYCAARLSRGAASPSQVRDKLLLQIYATHWPYGPNADWYWRDLVANIVKEPEDWRRGNCLAYADLWANLCMVHGAFADSRPIYSAWQLALPPAVDLRYWQGETLGREARIVTKQLGTLQNPTTPESWTFLYHQVGLSAGGCYDPVFNLSASGLPTYKATLLDAVRARGFPYFNFTQPPIQGDDLDSMIQAGYWRTYVEHEGLVYLLTCLIADSYPPPAFPALPESLGAAAAATAAAEPSQEGTPHLTVWTEGTEYDLAAPVTVRAAVTGTGGEPITGLTPQASFQHDDDSYELPMQDDGAHNDEAAGDGIYGAVFANAKVEGTWQACASASGMDQTQPFDLTECVLQGVLVRDLGTHFTGVFRDSPVDDDALPGFEGLGITASVDVTGSGEYWLRGTLSKGDTEICYDHAPVPQVSGEATVKLTFPGHLIRSAGMDGPYSAHLVLTGQDFTRIDDADYATAAYSVSTFQQGTPILRPIGDRRLAEGQLLLIDLHATDPEGDPIAYGVHTLPEGAGLDSGTGRFEWPLGYRDSGTYRLTFWASDGAASTEASTSVIIDETRVFLDVPFTGYGPEGHDPFWAYHQIEACWIAGIVQGYGDGLYRPDSSVTRDQMAVYISRALAGGDANVPSGPSVPSFSDVPTTHWAYKYIEYAKAQVIVSGYPDGDYQPSLPLDRAQMAVFIARAVTTPTDRPDLLGYTPPLTPSFPDVTADGEWGWAYRFVEYIAENAVTQGYPDGLYHPEYVCTRDQMAVYVQRAFQLPV